VSHTNKRNVQFLENSCEACCGTASYRGPIAASSGERKLLELELNQRRRMLKVIDCGREADNLPSIPSIS